MSTLRASVTAEAGGTNYVNNPSLANDVDGWATTGQAVMAWTNALPAPSPIGVSGCGLVTWGGQIDDALTIPAFSILTSNVYTVSVYIYVPNGGASVHLVADGVVGTSSVGTVDAWTRLWATFTATTDTPTLALVPDAPDAPETIGTSAYFSGALVAPGVTLTPYVAGGGQPGDPVQILVDGADTPVTANGLAGYIPTPGDRLLVQKVGGMVEVMQFISRGTTPYLQQIDLNDLQAQVTNNADLIVTHDEAISGLSLTVSDTSTALAGYQSSTDAALTTLQAGYDALSGVGAAGVEEDYFWVGDDPALSTVKSVQISTYVQDRLSAGDPVTFAAYFDLWGKADIGDVTYASSTPPMTTFYTQFTNAGLLALPWNS